MKKYPPPNDNPVFVKYWDILLKEIMKRDNFKPIHLASLEILCSLYVERQRLQDVLDMTGYSYQSSGGRYGDMYKNYPEVGQLNQCRSQIATYTKMLGLTLTRDTSPGGEDPEKEDDWD